MKEARTYYRLSNDDPFYVRIKVIDLEYITKIGTASFTLKDEQESSFYKYEVGFSLYDFSRNTTLHFWSYAYCKISDCNNLDISRVLNGTMLLKRQSDTPNRMHWIIEV